MMTLIASVLAAAPLPAPPATPTPHLKEGPVMPMSSRSDAKHAEKGECCCKDMMAKMHEGQGDKHRPPSGR